MQIRPITLEDLGAASRFNDGVNRANSATFQRDFFEWQYRRSGGVDRGADNGCWVAVDGDQVAGTCMNNLVDFWVDGRTVSGAWGHELYVDPTRKGAAGALLLMRVLGPAAFYGGSGHSLQAMILMKGLRPFHWIEIDRMIAIGNPEAAATLCCGQGDHTLAFLNTCRLPRVRSGVTVQAVDAFDDEYDAVWEQMREPFLAATDRTSTYMNWRYRDHPRFGYESVVCRSPRFGSAYFVWRREPVAGTEWHVVRLCEAIGRRDALADCCGAMLAEAVRPNTAYLDFFCSNADVRSALCGAGMHMALTLPDLDLPRLFQPLASDVRKRLNFSLGFHPSLGVLRAGDFHRTYITKGDSNQDRPNP